MSKSPAFQLYASDFYMDTSGWTATQIGIYFRLLMSEWVNGSLPNDTEQLSRIAQIDRGNFLKCYCPTIEGKFTPNGNGNLINRRLEEVRENQAKYRESQAEKGRHSAKKRWEGHIARVIPSVTNRLQPEDNSSSSSSSSSSKKKIKESISHSETKQFLTHYSERFKHHFGKDPMIEWAKDSTITKTLLKLIPIEDLKELIERFFTSEDKFILKSGYTIGVFKSQINKLQIGEPIDGVGLWLKAKEEQDARSRQKEVLALNEKIESDISNKP